MQLDVNPSPGMLLRPLGTNIVALVKTAGDAVEVAAAVVAVDELFAIGRGKG